MIPENRIPTHPGEILRKEFLNLLRLSQIAFAGHIGVPVQRIYEIVRGKRRITPESVWLFAEAFGNSPEFWLNLQMNYDLVRYRPKRQVKRIATGSYLIESSTSRCKGASRSFQRCRITYGELK